MLQRKLKSERGFSLTSMMVGIGLAGVVAAGSMQFIKNVNDNSASGDQKYVRDSIYSKIQRQSLSQTNLTLSSTTGSDSGNAALALCLAADGNNCAVTSNASQQTFEMYVPRGATTQRIAGSAAKPKYYGLDGRICSDTTTLSSTDCRPAWEATAYFWASCEGGVASCDKARSIYLRFQVKPVTSFSWKTTPKAKPEEPEFSSDKTSFSFAISLDGGLVLALSCPSLSVQQGIRADGRPKCICMSGTTQTGLNANNDPICAFSTSACLSTQKINGIDINGAPICVALGSAGGTPTCTTRTNSCGDNEWINNARLNRCTFNLTVYSSTSWTFTNISCPSPSFGCCY